MIKKPYLRPTTKVVEVRIAQLVCTSLRGVSSTGLDETLIYGDGETTEKNAWDYSW